MVQFATLEQRVANKQEVVKIVSDILRGDSTKHWVETFEARGVPVAPINSIVDALENVQVRHRNMVVEMDHPVVGLMQATGNPIKLSAMPETEFSPPPLLGQHTGSVLRELLGINNEELRDLREKRIIRSDY